MQVQMRNTQTGEIRPVVEGSSEFEAMRASRRHADDRPLWEQTSTADVVATEARLEQGQGKDTDVPDAGQPVDQIRSRVDQSGVRFGPDLTEPTPGEIEQGAGRAAEGAEQPNDISANTLGKEDLADLDEGDVVEPDAPEVLDEGLKLGGGGEGGYAKQSKGDLEEEAEERGLPVEGTGSGGNVTKSDLVKALEADDEKDAE